MTTTIKLTKVQLKDLTDAANHSENVYCPDRRNDATAHRLLEAGLIEEAYAYRDSAQRDDMRVRALKHLEDATMALATMNHEAAEEHASKAQWALRDLTRTRYYITDAGIAAVRQDGTPTAIQALRDQGWLQVTNYTNQDGRVHNLLRNIAGDQWMMTGGAYGSHTIHGSEERARAHWSGYRFA